MLLRKTTLLYLPPFRLRTAEVKYQRNAGTLRHLYHGFLYYFSRSYFVNLLWNTNENTVDSISQSIPNVQSLMIIKGTSELEKEVARNLTKRLKKDFTISSVSISDIAANDSPYSLARAIMLI